MRMRSLTLTVVLSAALCLGLLGVVMGGSSANHAVTVTASAINEASISGGSITLTINAATAGSDPDAVGDSLTCDFLWTTNEASKKITVGTALASYSYSLKVKALSPTSGSAAAEVTLDDTDAHDFVTGVGTSAGQCDLRYIGSATAAAGTGSDEHTTVPYTIAAEGE